MYMAGVALAAMAISSCDEDTLTIGQSLTGNADKLDVTSTAYPVATRTIVADSVFTLSSTCYLGQIKDPETNTNVKSEFTTQFHLLEYFNIAPEGKVLSQYNNMAAADSCDIILFLNSPFNTADSLQAVKMQVSELLNPMEEGMRYYSNYDPAAHGHLRADGLRKGKMFTYLNLTDPDSVRAGTYYYDNIRITLNEPYTDLQGNTYNNYGTYLLQQYYRHPEYFKNSYTFTHRVCPGFFFEITDGYGFYSEVSDIGLRTYYKVQGDTSVVNTAFTIAGTKEVLQTTYVTNDMDNIRNMAAETTHTYLKSPAGLFTEVTLPVADIMNGHQTDSLLAAKIVFQRINNNSSDDRQLSIPSSVLMLPKDSLTTFFENKNVPDNKSAFLTTFQSATNTYEYTNISSIITLLWHARTQGLAANPNWEAEHPDWNKVLLVPVTYTTTSSSSSTPVSMEHGMMLTSTRLVGGRDNPYDPITINVVYGKFFTK